MSSKIDERVVAMKIDHGQFMKGTNESIGALESLKRSLNFDGAKKGIEDLNATSRNFSLNGMAQGVDDLASKFSGMQAIALGALATIGAKAVEIGTTLVQKLGNSLTKDIQSGFSDYNTKLSSVQTIMNATGADIQTVNGYFKQLDTYSDKTVFNLSDMTGAFAKFTNAGVDMKTSVPAIQGIANMVALAGQGANEASIAMYNLSQSIGGGFLTTTDFKSLNLANVATQEWKDNMIKAAVAAGTLKDTGKGTYAILADGSGKAATAQSLFTEELSSGWASTSILLKVLNDYGDLTTDIGKKAFAAAQNVRSIPMMFETLSAASGTGWTDSFEILLGNVTEATSLLTYLTGEFGAFTAETSKARNAQLQLWKDMGGRDAIIEAIHNAFAALESVMGPLKSAWAQVFPPKLGKTLAAISFAIRDFTKGLILSADAQKNLKMVAVAVFSVLKFGIDIITGIVGVIWNFVKIAFQLAGAIGGLLTPFLTFVRNLLPVSKGASEATSSVSKFFDMLKTAQGFLTGWLITGLQNLGGLINGFLNDGSAQKRVESFMQTLKGLGQVVAMVWNVLAKGDFTGNPFFQEDSKFVDILFNIRDAMLSVLDAFKQFGSGVAQAGKNAGSFWTGVGKVIQTVWNFIKPIAGEIKKFFTSLIGGLDLETVLATVNTGVLLALAIAIGKAIKKITAALSFVGDFKKGLLDGLNGLTGVLESYQKKLKAEALLKIAVAIAVLAGALWVLAQIPPDRLISAVAGMATAFGILIGGFAILDKIDAEPSLKASAALSLIAIAVNVLASAVAKMGALDPAHLAGGLIGIAVAMGLLLFAAEAMSHVDAEKLIKASTAMILMATSVNIMAGAVAIFGLLPIDNLVQGLLAVGIVMAGMVLAAQYLSDNAPKMVMSAVGLMAMAAALNMLVIPITALGLLPMPILLQGIISLAIVLALLVGAAILLSKLAPAMVLSAVGLLAMAVAINLLVAPIVLLGLLPIPTLIQGLIALVAVIGILVLAALAMSGLIVGATGMVAMAAAILILSVALAIMSGIGIDAIIQGFLGLAIAIVGLAVLAAIITPFIPVMVLLAVTLGIVGFAMIAMSVAMVIFAVGLTLIGPALIIATGGLLVFAKAAPALMGAVGPMLALGAALLVFGAGALVAGAGVLVLGVGLILLGAGLALVGAVGLIGATALTAVVNSMMKLIGNVPGILIMAGTFVVLGAAVLVLGAGLLVLGAGGILTALALMMLVPMGALVAISFGLLMKAIEKLIPMADKVKIIGVSLGQLGKAVVKLASNGMDAANGLNAIGMSFNTLGMSALLVAATISAMSAKLQVSMVGIQLSLALGATFFQQFAIAAIMSITMMNAGLVVGFGQVQASARSLTGTLGVALVIGIASTYGPVYKASVTIGDQMIAGMNRGLQNGSYSVSQMASQVAANALRASKKTLGVASPSKEYEKIGMWSDEGLANGMLKNVGTVEAASEDTAKAAMNAVKQSLSDIKNSVASDMDLAPVITPVLDLTSVQKDAAGLNGMLKAPTLTVADSYARASYLSSAQQPQTDTTTSTDSTDSKSSINFTQNNYSPKALSQAEIYRNTKNAISLVKKEAPV